MAMLTKRQIKALVRAPMEKQLRASRKEVFDAFKKRLKDIESGAELADKKIKKMLLRAVPIYLDQLKLLRKAGAKASRWEMNDLYLTLFRLEHLLAVSVHGVDSTEAKAIADKADKVHTRLHEEEEMEAMMGPRPDED